MFSTIEDNHIHHIALKREFYGYEIGGIKLHAALDVVIRHNRIHDCSLGIWLDWQTQGTRVSRNLLYANNRDLFIEVSHGPHLVEHNVLASPASLELFSQGGAFVNDLLCGTVLLQPVVERPTPYHVPHSTQVAGYAAILGGDDRYIGNVFLAGDPGSAYGPTLTLRSGGRQRHRWLRRAPRVAGRLPRPGRRPVPRRPRALHERQAGGLDPRQRLRGGRRRVRGRARSRIVLDDVTVAVVEDGEEVYLETQLPAAFDEARTGLITGEDLERVRFVDAEFEEPDGSPARLDTDLVGAPKTGGQSYAAGPLATLASGSSRTRVW